MTAKEAALPTTEQLEALESDPRLRLAAEMVTTWDSYIVASGELMPDGESTASTHEVVKDFLSDPNVDPRQKSVFVEMTASLGKVMKYERLGYAMDRGKYAMSLMAETTSSLEMPNLGVFASFSILEIENYKERTQDAMVKSDEAEHVSRVELSKLDADISDVSYGLSEIEVHSTRLIQALESSSDEVGDVESEIDTFLRVTSNAVAEIGTMDRDQMMSFLVSYAENEPRFAGLIESTLQVQGKSKDTFSLSDVIADLSSAKGWASGIEQLVNEAGVTEEALVNSKPSLMRTADANRGRFRDTRAYAAVNFDSVAVSFNAVKGQILDETSILLEHTSTRK